MGFKLNEKLGKYAFWCWFVGFFVAFLPLYVLGFMGATRRLNHYDVPGWQPLFVVAAIGALIIFAGVCFQVLQVIVSIKQRNENRDTTGDPWNARSLEWSTSSPPPHYNFANTPEVHSRDAFWEMKQSKTETRPEYHPIHMPKNSSVGVFVGLFSFTLTFGLIWYMWWLAIASTIALVATLILRLFVKETEYYVPVEEVEKIESARQNV